MALGSATNSSTVRLTKAEAEAQNSGHSPIKTRYPWVYEVHPIPNPGFEYALSVR